jgi:hypothetical protein
VLERAEIACFDVEAWHLLHDFRVLMELQADHASGFLEDPGDEAAVHGETIAVPYRPHEIITLLVE